MRTRAFRDGCAAVIAAVLAPVVASGCALLREPEVPVCPEPPPAVAAPVARPPDPLAIEGEEVLGLLAYNQKLQTLTADEQRREYQAANQAFQRERSDASRMRLVLVLAVAAPAWRDDARLTALLEGAAARSNPAESPRRQFVALVQKWVSERLREQRRADELQQKLDAMLRIERSLRERSGK